MTFVLFSSLGSVAVQITSFLMFFKCLSGALFTYTAWNLVQPALSHSFWLTKCNIELMPVKQLPRLFKVTLNYFHEIHCFIWYLTDKRAGKFKEWIDCASLIDMKPNTPIMEIFSYLAYETIGQVTNCVVWHCRWSWNAFLLLFSKFVCFYFDIKS